MGECVCLFFRSVVGLERGKLPIYLYSGNGLVPIYERLYRGQVFRVCGANY